MQTSSWETSSPTVESVGDGAFSLEMPDEAPVVEVQFDDVPAEDAADVEDEPAAPTTASEAIDGIASALSRASAPARPPLPSYAVVIIGGLSLACLALSVALIAALSQPDANEFASTPDTVATPAEAAPEAAAVPTADVDSEGTGAMPADFPAPSVPIPADFITDIEAASDEPLEVELGRLLAAIGHGFGTQSARLEPTLRPYVYRMAARFEWNPDTHRIAVTAPDARLAEARKALLEGLFADAVASGRLAIGTGTGPHDLTLVTS